MLVLGEEVGWRGYAQPRLATHVGAVVASALIGILWAIWHLPLFFMPAMPQYRSPILPYVVYTIALSIILGVLTRRTGGSVVIATVFHGAVNALGIVNRGATIGLRGWANALSYGVAAVAMCVVARDRVRRIDDA